MKAVKVSPETLRGILQSSEFLNSSSKVKTAFTSRYLHTGCLPSHPENRGRGLLRPAIPFRCDLYMTNMHPFLKPILPSFLPGPLSNPAFKYRQRWNKAIYREWFSNQQFWSMDHYGGVCTGKNVASVVPDELPFSEKHIGTILFSEWSLWHNHVWDCCSKFTW